jgi:hypothetical protein
VSRPRSLIVLTLLALLVAAPASATSVIQLDVPTHVAESTAVVEVLVGAATEALSEETGRTVTDRAVAVERVLYGEAPATLKVRQHRSDVGEQRYAIPGDGRLTEGGRFVLFLTRGPDGRWYLTALGQSVFAVRGSGDDAGVHQQLDGLGFFAYDGTGKLVPASPEPGPKTLGELRRAVAAAKGE